MTDRTPLTAEQDEQINRLLHDYEHALAGAHFARTLAPNPEVERRLSAKAAGLLAKANTLDPRHLSEWWEELSDA